eukprot:Protomagalhaensia_sp_Gyna_25__1697@NODE_1886_length_1446_cov_12_695807_g1550_i0_p2_GENE_NODE_1886_length_1446_cov_12_695807_g1550_i0NODE_1886_length_1446_cov_12_695807_g1550_i0_p2_ORF_typecomplete_len168_score14_58MAP65_ASE1/PF03999_12/0_022RNA_pol_Rpc4/PF05132_14/1_4e02RNA_pol_Rpc4/PF05132_14/37_NODE_1886_length_1446_cov_12_695807_g1550_i09421400
MPPVKEIRKRQTSRKRNASTSNPPPPKRVRSRKAPKKPAANSSKKNSTRPPSRTPAARAPPAPAIDPANILDLPVVVTEKEPTRLRTSSVVPWSSVKIVNNFAAHWSLVCKGPLLQFPRVLSELDDIQEGTHQIEPMLSNTTINQVRTECQQ